MLYKIEKANISNIPNYYAGGRILDLITVEATKESVKYICENGSNARMFGDRAQLLKFMLEEYVKNNNYKNKLFLEFGVFEGWQ